MSSELTPTKIYRRQLLRGGTAALVTSSCLGLAVVAGFDANNAIQNSFDHLPVKDTNPSANEQAISDLLAHQFLGLKLEDEFKLIAGSFSAGLVSSVFTDQLIIFQKNLNALQTRRKLLFPGISQATSKRPDLVPFYLAPLGIKIPAIDDNRRRFCLPPRIAAEEQQDPIFRHLKKGELGKIGFVYQLTVQGRLPDDMKYAALALITSSPFYTDWSGAFYEAPWGQVAPMVHDGGVVNYETNPLWKKTKGRTDFIQRFFYKSMHEDIPQENTTIEPERLMEIATQLTRQSVFWQRHATALHVKEGTSPKEIPTQVQIALTNDWNNFKDKMVWWFNMHNLQSVLSTTWFNEQEMKVPGWPGKRKEAKWGPIQDELLKLEEVRIKNPELIQGIKHLIATSTDSINAHLGLGPLVLS